ncbi:MAG: glycosyltransferase family 4 protein [Saprospiraceae bacterium]
MSTPKRICLICVEIFAWGKYGGFGKATRIIGRELVKRGYEVFAVVPRRENQQEEEILDGIQVLSFKREDLLSSGKIYKKIKADIYHSCEPSLGTWLAMKDVPKATHLVTARDPRERKDWMMEFSYPSQSRLQVIQNYIYEYNFIVRKAVRNAEGVFVPAHFLKEKAKRIYNYHSEIGFLPTPTEIPEHVFKSEKPSVLYMCRIDPRKRPELTLSLAGDFPDVTFHIAGKARMPAYESDLKEKYGHFPNLHFHGFINQFEGNAHHELLSQSWIHINTSVREGLPNSFVEAAGHKCAILSQVNPDDFASKFGIHVEGEDFAKGLSALLTNDLWKSRGEKGFEYVRDVYEVSAAIQAHEEVYHRNFRRK